MRSYSLKQLPVNQTFVNELATVGITTVLDVLDHDTSPVDTVPQGWFDSLHVVSELLTVPGVGPKLAGQLYWAEVRSVSALADCDPDKVCAAILCREERFGDKGSSEKRLLVSIKKVKVAASSI